MLVVHGSHILPVSLATSSAPSFHQKISTSVPVLAVAFNNDGSKFAAVLDNKSVALWEQLSQDWKPFGKPFILPKKPSAITFTPESDSILVADRFGNVHKFGLKDILSGKNAAKATGDDHEDEDGDDHEDDENPSGKDIEDEAQNIILGHFGTISDLRFTGNGKHLISADRDDRIRVSRWPHAYVVQSFCLGHTNFVVQSKPVGASNFVVSGSGDGTVRSWNILTGAEVGKVDLDASEAKSASSSSSEDAPRAKSIVTEIAVDSGNGLVFTTVEG
jgi:tRNA (guanine-N(7)-)-methyltransferase subunit TRM82